MTQPLDTSGGFGPVQTVPARGGITRQVFDIFRDRFGIEATVLLAVTVLRKEINPVVDVEWIAPLGDAQENLEINLDVAAGSFVAAFTVPETEKWLTKWVQRSATTGASLIRATINGVNVNVTTASTASVGLAMEIMLEPGDSLGMEGTDNAGDASRDMSLAYIRYLVR